MDKVLIFLILQDIRSFQRLTPIKIFFRIRMKVNGHDLSPNTNKTKVESVKLEKTFDFEIRL